MADLPIAWLGSRAGTTLAARVLRSMAAHLRGGTLVVVDDAGTHRFGGGTPEVTMVVHDPVVYRDTLLQGSVGLGRGYADGLWDCDDLTTLTRVLSRGLRPVTTVQDRVGQVVEKNLQIGRFSAGRLALVHVLDDEPPAEPLVKLLGAIDIGNGDDDDLELHVHRAGLRRENRLGAHRCLRRK